MRWTQTLIPTMKETPEGAEIPSHVLMLRAGLVSQVMAGAYTYLPLGLRALRKAERIVREEMDAAGAVELLMPALTPIRLWEQTGRVAGLRRRADPVRRPPAEPQGADGPGPDPRGSGHRPGLPPHLQLSADADHALPDPDQVPQRGAAAVRRAADQRIPHEGRLQLRHLRRVAQPELREDVRRLLPHLRPLRAATICPSRPRAGRSAATPATSSWSRPTTARTRCCTAATAATRPTWRRPRSAAATWCRRQVAAAAARQCPRPGPAPSSRSAGSSAQAARR